MINFNKEEHKYTDNSGEEYVSVTRFINRFVPVFDFDKKSMMYAAKYGMDVDRVRQEWKQKNLDSTDFGTKIHLRIEKALSDRDYQQTECDSITDAICNEITNTFKGNYLTEHIVCNPCNKIAGTSDLIIDNNDNFSIIDFKTNKQIKYTNDFDEKSLLKPISHLPNSEYFKYSLQLSFYAYFYSLLTNKAVDRLAFFWLKRKNPKDYKNTAGSVWVRYNTPYLKEEVITCLEYARENKLG